MLDNDFILQPIGVVESTLIDLNAAPMQGDEGAPDAWLVVHPEAAAGLMGMSVGNEIIVLTWLHLADRETLQVQPRSDRNRPLAGVFTTRAPDRPNPIGLHRVSVLEVADGRLHVTPLEAINGTPIVDIKPVLSGSDPSER